MRELSHGDPDAVLPPPMWEHEMRHAELMGRVVADAAAHTRRCGYCTATYVSQEKLDEHLVREHPGDVFGDAA